VSRISTHVLDVSRGRPGSGVHATLEFRTATGWEVQGGGTTDEDGRIDSLHSEATLGRGTYRLTFDTGSYFRLKGQESFYPRVVIVFEVARTEEHYHIPLLLNGFGYTTYRGS
jgi:5-hydroxyisourate hydrolase